MAAAEPEEGFKVTDRRKRLDEELGPPRETPPPPPPLGEEAQRLGDAAHAVRGEERSLVGLFTMLASSALIALGEAPDPVTGELHHDLGNAADIIDVLMLLRERTEGRRLPEETEALEQLIYDLQLRYVSATRRS